MPRSKKALETPKLGGKHLTLESSPSVSLRSDDPFLTGYRFVGQTSEEALINARAFLIPFYKSRGYWPVTVTIKDQDGDSA